MQQLNSLKVKVNDCTIQSSTNARNLGAVFHSTLSIDKFIAQNPKQQCFIYTL